MAAEQQNSSARSCTSGKRVPLRVVEEETAPAIQRRTTNKKTQSGVVQNLVSTDVTFLITTCYTFTLINSVQGLLRTCEVLKQSLRQRFDTSHQVQKTKTTIIHQISLPNTKIRMHQQLFLVQAGMCCFAV